MSEFKIRRQRPVKGGREVLPSCVIRDIRAAVIRDAKKFNVSRSFVVAVALSNQLGVRLFEDYHEPLGKKRRKR